MITMSIRVQIGDVDVQFRETAGGVDIVISAPNNGSLPIRLHRADVPMFFAALATIERARG
jgi:hypothetical protein